jgi:hypothetical protein
MVMKKISPGGKFPTFPVLLLVVGILWLLSELQVITVAIPWWPVILIIVSLGWLVNVYQKK